MEESHDGNSSSSERGSTHIFIKSHTCVVIVDSAAIERLGQSVIALSLRKFVVSSVVSCEILELLV